MNDRNEFENDEWIDLNGPEMMAANINRAFRCPSCGKLFVYSNKTQRFAKKSDLICDPNKVDKKTQQRGCGKNIFSEWQRILNSNK